MTAARRVRATMLVGYAATIVWALSSVPGAEPARLLMVALAVLVLASDLAEQFHILPAATATRRTAALAVAIWGALLAVVAYAASLPPAQASTYFAALVGVSFLQATRDVVLAGVDALELLRRGHPHLAGLYVVFGAAADLVVSFRLRLLWLGVAVFLLRKAFVWRDIVETDPPTADSS